MEEFKKKEKSKAPGSAILNKGNPDGFDQMPHWQKMQYKVNSRTTARVLIINPCGLSLHFQQSFRAWVMYNLDGEPITSLTTALHDGTTLFVTVTS